VASPQNDARDSSCARSGGENKRRPARAGTAASLPSLLDLSAGISQPIQGRPGGAHGTGTVPAIQYDKRRGDPHDFCAARRCPRWTRQPGSILLAVIGGALGVMAGAAATAVYASSKSWAVVIPAEAWTGGIASAVLIGAFAGPMPAVRASRMPPTVAFRTVCAGSGSLSRGHPARAPAVSVASWAMAMARTMDSPRPWVVVYAGGRVAGRARRGGGPPRRSGTRSRIGVQTRPRNEPAKIPPYSLAATGLRDRRVASGTRRQECLTPRQSATIHGHSRRAPTSRGNSNCLVITRFSPMMQTQSGCIAPRRSGVRVPLAPSRGGEGIHARDPRHRPEGSSPPSSMIAGAVAAERGTFRHF
jgi:hypothetical protein